MQWSQANGESSAAHAAALQIAADWAARNTFSLDNFSLDRLLAVKGASRISVVIPTRSVAQTIGQVVGECVELRELGLVDQVVVIDSDSTDGTVERAIAAGAELHQEDELMVQFGPTAGKGDALWRSLSVAHGDLVVFVDGDTVDFGSHFVRGLVGPLLCDDALSLVKGSFRRPFVGGEMRVADGGGRVTELTARPLLNMFFPQLAAVHQPLSGEVAGRREVFQQLPFMTGYGVETQILIDVFHRFGLASIAQVELGERVNPHQPLHALGAMAFTVLRVVMSRADWQPTGGEAATIAEFANYVDGDLRLRAARLDERPPWATFTAAAARLDETRSVA